MLSLTKIFDHWWEIVLFLMLAAVLIFQRGDNFLIFYPLLGLLFILLWFSFYLDRLLLLIIITFPFINWQIYATSELNAPPVDWLGLGLLIAFGIYLLRTKDIKKISFPYLVPFLLFLAVGLLSLTQSYFIPTGIKYLLRPMLFCYLIYLVLPVNIIKSKIMLKKVIWAWYLIVFLIALISALTFLLNFSQGELPVMRLTPFSFGNFAPLGTNQNLLAELIATTLPLGLLLIMANRDKKPLVKFIIGSWLLMIFTILFTFSRAAWLSLLLQLTLFYFVLWPYLPQKDYWQKKIKNVFKELVPMATIILIPILLLMVGLMQSNVTSSSNLNRFFQWKIGLEMFNNNIFLGTGPGSFIEVLNRDPYFIYEFGGNLEAHGLILKLISEVGLLGLLALLTFFVVLFWQNYSKLKSLRSQSNDFFVPVCLWLAAVSAVFFQLFNTSYYTAKMWLPLGIMTAATALYVKKFRPKN